MIVIKFRNNSFETLYLLTTSDNTSERIMAKLYEITNWNKREWYSTGGTRDKKYVQDPISNKNYYFKKSYKTDGRDYFFEFWSEIIASEVGTSLGFNMLTYDIAIDGDVMGCISESMINVDGEELVEGGKYLQAKDNRFTPTIKERKKLYTFQLIVEALNAFGLGDYTDKIIEIIIFDAIIGNGDRHQENWAFISTNTYLNQTLKRVDEISKDQDFYQQPKWVKWLLSRAIDLLKRGDKPEKILIQLYLKKIKGITPIYDSGSSLGRELSEDRIAQMLDNESELISYINRGVSEIHWNQKKLKHFELLYQLLESPYAELTQNIIKRSLDKYKENQIQEIIVNIDTLVPESMIKYRLPEARKRLMYKLITLRIEKLKQLISNERV